MEGHLEGVAKGILLPATVKKRPARCLQAQSEEGGTVDGRTVRRDAEVVVAGGDPADVYPATEDGARPVL